MSWRRKRPENIKKVKTSRKVDLNTSIVIDEVEKRQKKIQDQKIKKGGKNE